MAVVNGQPATQDFAAEIARLRHEDADLKAESECLGKPAISMPPSNNTGTALF